MTQSKIWSTGSCPTFSSMGYVSMDKKFDVQELSFTFHEMQLSVFNHLSETGPATKFVGPAIKPKCRISCSKIIEEFQEVTAKLKPSMGPADCTSHMLMKALIGRAIPVPQEPGLYRANAKSEPFQSG